MSDKKLVTTEENTTPDGQGFNDAELEDIMNEIESLEKEFVNDDVYAEAQDAMVEAEIQEGLGISGEETKEEDLVVDEQPNGKTKLQETIDSEVDTLLDERETEAENVIPIPERKVAVAPALKPVSTSGVPGTQMDFSVAGDVNIKLNFTFGDQTVHLYVSEEEGFIIEMAGGGRFTLPTPAATRDKIKKVG